MNFYNSLGILASTDLATINPDVYIGDIISGMCAFWDGKAYVTGPTWANQILVPADGAAQMDYDVTNNGCTYSINKWLMTGSSYFAGTQNPPLVASMHKSVANTSWTWFTRITTGNTVTTDPVPLTAGTGYAVNDHITLNQIYGSVATVLKVTSISGGGGTGPIATVAVTTGGIYTSQPSAPIGQASTTGSGTGVTFNIVINPTLNAVFGDASNNGDYGILINVDSSGNLKLQQYNGVSSNQKTATMQLGFNSEYNLAFGYDFNSNVITVSVNNTVWQTFTPTGWTGSITNAATDVFGLGGNSSTGSFKFMPQSTQMFCSGLVNHNLSVSELATLFAYLDARYQNNVNPNAPGQVISVVAQGSDGAFYAAWAKPDDGGATITDYKQEYKLSASPTWINWAHSASQNLFTEITGVTNGLIDDFRASAINSLGTGPTSTVVTASPVPAGTPPYDLSLFTLTLPVNSSGQRFGIGLEIDQPALLTFNDAWFGRADGMFIFNVPDGGASTVNSNFCRSELRNTANIPNTTPTSDTLKFSVPVLQSNTKMICHQIHAPNNAPYKLIYLGSTNGTGMLYAITQPILGGPTTTTTIKTGMTNGDITILRSVYTGTQLQWFLDANWNGTNPNVSIPFNMNGNSGGTYYYKRGAYYDDNSMTGTIATVYHFTQPGTYGS